MSSLLVRAAAARPAGKTRSLPVVGGVSQLLLSDQLLLGGVAVASVPDHVESTTRSSSRSSPSLIVDRRTRRSARRPRQSPPSFPPPVRPPLNSMTHPPVGKKQ